MSKYDYLKEKLTFKQHNYEYYNIRNLDSNKYCNLSNFFFLFLK